MKDKAKEEVKKDKNREARKIEDFIMETRHVVMELTADFLGTVPKDKAIYASHIQSKAKDFVTEEDKEEELGTIEEVEEKGWTGFHSDEQGIFIFNYMQKGFIKTAAETLMEIGMIPKIVAYKKRIDNFIFISPRRIRFTNGNGEVIEKPDGVLERPLRTMTRQGPRVTLARSDIVHAGRQLAFDIRLLPSIKGFDWTDIDECLDYGRLNGLGQWRASGEYGTFKIISFE